MSFYLNVCNGNKVFICKISLTSNFHTVEFAAKSRHRIELLEITIMSSNPTLKKWLRS